MATIQRPPMPAGVSVQVANLGKIYRIGALQDAEKTLGEVIADTFKRPAQMIRALVRGERVLHSERDTIWALRNVSFDVPRGAVVGIIGRNGAGKSTLLKVLTRITNPDEGFARIRGRVGSLLEVGTGFHGELTGRENVYLNGAILGMRREEIDDKFDDIVAFSGVERFIDTPVKRYSSGMYLRLAFSVAAHLEPDILLVDEVLAVGDAEFQKKCLGKMSDVAGEGRTVLFVSHNMDAVQQLCDTVIWLENGQMRQIGSVADVVQAYLMDVEAEKPENRFPVMNKRYGIGFAGCDVHLEPDPVALVHNLRIDISVQSEQDWPRIGIGFGLNSDLGAKVSRFGPHLTNFVFDMRQGITRFVLEIPGLDQHLAAGTYAVNMWLSMPGIGRLVDLDYVGIIRVPGRDIFGSGQVVNARIHGATILPLTIRHVQEISE
jgi:lipopolysaccharide transport system ATP-binding protein